MFVDDSGSWSLGVLIGGPAIGLLILAALALIAIGVVIHLETRDGVPVILAGLTALVVFMGGAVWAYYPPRAEYHQWRDVSGTVAQIDSRLISGSKGGAETKFVVRFEESGEQFACDDTRCAQVSEGDDLTLSCKRAWQFTGTDGYDCRFVSVEATA